jgi:hypothetical protein
MDYTGQFLPCDHCALEATQNPTEGMSVLENQPSLLPGSEISYFFVTPV